MNTHSEFSWKWQFDSLSSPRRRGWLPPRTLKCADQISRCGARRYCSCEFVEKHPGRARKQQDPTASSRTNINPGLCTTEPPAGDEQTPSDNSCFGCSSMRQSIAGWRQVKKKAFYKRRLFICSAHLCVNSPNARDIGCEGPAGDGTGGGSVRERGQTSPLAPDERRWNHQSKIQLESSLHTHTPTARRLHSSDDWVERTDQLWPERRIGSKRCSRVTPAMLRDQIRRFRVLKRVREMRLLKSSSTPTPKYSPPRGGET